MYFVKVDVQACFDTIEQGKLISIIRELIAHVELGFCYSAIIANYLLRTNTLSSALERLFLDLIECKLGTFEMQSQKVMFADISYACTNLISSTSLCRRRYAFCQVR